MTSKEKRLEEIINGLSPEEKARLAIEDAFRKEPALSPGDHHKVVRALKDQERNRYDRVMDRLRALLPSLRLLVDLVGEVKSQLLLRDRILWYERALIDIEEAIILNPAIAGPLLVKNPSLKPDEPLEIRLVLGTVRLGVWGRKKRSPFGKMDGVQLDERVAEALQDHIGHVRRAASEIKAIHSYLVEESRAIGLEFMEGVATGVARQISEYDRPLLEDLLQEMRNGAPTSYASERQSVFPVDKDRALVWEEIEEDAETARRIRDDPEHWVPASCDQVMENSGQLLEILKGEAATGPPRP